MCFDGVSCDVTLHGAAAQRFAQSVCQGIFDVKADVAEAHKVTELNDFDEFGSAALSAQEQNTYSPSEEVTSLASRNRLRRLTCPAKRILPTRIPERAKAA